MEEAACRPDAFATVITTLSFFSLCVSWWLVDLPLLVLAPTSSHDASSSGATSSSSSSSPPPAGRVRLFLRAVAWNCLRALQPTYMGVVALARAVSEGGRNGTAAWPLLYYFGDALPNHPQLLRPTALQWAKVLLLDGVTLATEVLLVVYGYTSVDERERRLFAVGMWLLSSTPACVLGAYLLLFVSPRVSRLHRSGRLPVAAGLLVLAGLAFILALYMSVPKDRVPMTAGIMAMQWAFPLLPLVACRCDCCGNARGKPWQVMALLFGASFRCLMLTLDVASSISDEFWFCRVSPQAVGWVMGLVGGVVFLGFAIKGLGDVERHRPDVVKLWKGQQQGALTAESYVPLQDDEERQDQPQPSPLTPSGPPPVYEQQQQQQQQQPESEDHAETDVFDTAPQRRSTDLPSYQAATQRTDSMPPSYGEAAPDGQLVR